MYKEVGDIFEYQGIKLQVIETCSIFCIGCPLFLKNAKECNALRKSCKDCYFYEIPDACDTILCCNSERIDDKNVIFKEVQ